MEFAKCVAILEARRNTPDDHGHAHGAGGGTTGRGGCCSCGAEAQEAGLADVAKGEGNAELERQQGERDGGEPHQGERDGGERLLPRENLNTGNTKEHQESSPSTTSPAVTGDATSNGKVEDANTIDDDEDPDIAAAIAQINERFNKISTSKDGNASELLNHGATTSTSTSLHVAGFSFTSASQDVDMQQVADLEASSAGGSSGNGKTEEEPASTACNHVRVAMQTIEDQDWREELPRLAMCASRDMDGRARSAVARAFELETDKDELSGEGDPSRDMDVDQQEQGLHQKNQQETQGKNGTSAAVARWMLKVQERRVALQKAWDAVLKRLIARREVRTGYGPLVQKVTKAVQEVNESVRDVLDNCNSLRLTELTLGTPAYQDALELRELIEQIQKSEKQRMELSAATHLAQIRLYTLHLGGACSGSQVASEAASSVETARRQHYEEMGRLRQAMKDVEEEVATHEADLRYGFLI
ncbi:unnamed protein product [Amoebophrya sp. A25]|nr:unnamed protein product [Amoebophrya sp. A25]|eukprot:GSA25T00023499001.1